MNSSFSKALELGGMSSTTALIIRGMIVFLIVLIVGIGLALYSQLKKDGSIQEKSSKKIRKPEGF